MYSSTNYRIEETKKGYYLINKLNNSRSFYATKLEAYNQLAWNEEHFHNNKIWAQVTPISMKS